MVVWSNSREHTIHHLPPCSVALFSLLASFPLLCLPLPSRQIKTYKRIIWLCQSCTPPITNRGKKIDFFHSSLSVFEWCKLISHDFGVCASHPTVVKKANANRNESRNVKCIWDIRNASQKNEIRVPNWKVYVYSSSAVSEHMWIRNIESTLNWFSRELTQYRYICLTSWLYSILTSIAIIALQLDIATFIRFIFFGDFLGMVLDWWLLSEIHNLAVVSLQGLSVSRQSYLASFVQAYTVYRSRSNQVWTRHI